MKILMWHAAHVSMQSGWKARDYDRMVKRYPHLDDRTITQFKTDNALLVLATIEERDAALDKHHISQEIVAVARRTGAQKIVFASFGHLSRKIAPHPQAQKVIQTVCDELAKKIPVVLMPFGYDKSLELSVPLHHYNCGYREFKPTLKERISHEVEKRKGWIKLNVAYIPVAFIAPSAAFLSAQLAEKYGIAREHATTWIAGFCAVACGLTVNCIAWIVQNRKKYQKDKSLMKQDIVTLVKSVLKAQSITWIVTFGATYIAVSSGASNALAVTIQQVLDKVVFIPLYNYLNRKLAHEKPE